MRSWKCDGCGKPAQAEGNLIRVKLDIGGRTAALLHACGKQCLRTVAVALAAGVAKASLDRPDDVPTSRQSPGALPPRGRGDD